LRKILRELRVAAKWPKRFGVWSGIRHAPDRRMRNTFLRYRSLASCSLLLAFLGCAGERSLAVDESGVTEAPAVDLSDQYTGLWTNWWREPFDLETLKIAGLTKLRKVYDVIKTERLVDTGGRSGDRPSCTDTTVRTIDGTCTDKTRPLVGAAGARFSRNVPLADVVAEDERGTLMKPNPREVSLKLLARKTENGQPKFQEAGMLNLLAASWIQFQTHDWFSHPQQTGEIFKIRYGAETFFVPKSVEDPHPDLPQFPRLKTYRNETTSWWDGSQLYGSDAATATRLRSRDGRLVPGGLLRLDDERVPVVDGKEYAGFTRNWWVGLSMLHTLFAREHNAIATHLKETHPDFSDQKIFDLARMINAVVMAKIHTTEWTPSILQNPAHRTGMLINWNGLTPAPGSPLPVIPPIPGTPMQPVDTEIPFAHSEEFVSVYRMHALLPESLRLSSLSAPDRVTMKPVEATRNGLKDVPGYSLEDLFQSFGTSHPGALTLHNYPRFLQRLDVPVIGKIDMGMIDILRDRERGVPRYNALRRQIRLHPITKFEDLFLSPPDGTPSGQAVTGELTAEQAELVRELEDVYGKGPEGVERLDLLVGCLAESVRPTGFGFGETVFRIFELQTLRRLTTDRFYKDDLNEATYTKEGMDWIRSATMKNVLLRHYPELAKTGLANVENGNAFLPWR